MWFVRFGKPKKSKYLSEKFSGDLLYSVKQKRVYQYEDMDSFEKFSEDINKSKKKKMCTCCQYLEYG